MDSGRGKEESALKKPLDLISSILTESFVAKLHAYDNHQNMILGVEEIATALEIDDETCEEIVKGILGDTGFPTTTPD